MQFAQKMIGNRQNRQGFAGFFVHFAYLQAAADVVLWTARAQAPRAEFRNW